MHGCDLKCNFLYFEVDSDKNNIIYCIYSGPWDDENYLVIIGILLYQGKKQTNNKCVKNVYRARTSKITLLEKCFVKSELFIMRLHCI